MVHAQVAKHYRTSRTPQERFWEKVNKTETCWLWTGAPTLETLRDLSNERR